MFYRPNFCCQCGEKIVRPQWTPLTSRRFCEFCEIEQKQHELLPRVAAIIVLLIGAAGIIGYFHGSGDGSAEPTSAVSRSASKRQFADDARRNSEPDRDHSNAADRDVGNASVTANIGPDANVKQRQDQQKSSTDPVYYCGAITKKGTPCTRRVKTKTRCWQHTGQPGGQ